MRNVSILVLSMVAILPMVSGCGKSDVVVTEVAKSKAGLNGGVAFPLPESQGYAELVVERGKPGQPVVIAVYLLDDTATKAMTAKASSIKATLQLPTDPEPKTVAFTEKPKAAGKPPIGTRFATAPGPYDFDELKGDIFVTIDGKELTVPFALR